MPRGPDRDQLRIPFEELKRARPRGLAGSGRPCGFRAASPDLTFPAGLDLLGFADDSPALQTTYDLHFRVTPTPRSRPNCDRTPSHEGRAEESWLAWARRKFPP